MFVAPALLNVTPATLSPFVNPAAVNAFVPSTNVVLYALFVEFAVITSGTVLTVNVPTFVSTL